MGLGAKIVDGRALVEWPRAMMFGDDFRIDLPSSSTTSADQRRGPTANELLLERGDELVRPPRARRRVVEQGGRSRRLMGRSRLMIRRSRSFASRASGQGLALFGGRGSVTIPPPIVSSGEDRRRTKRSPARRTTGASRSSRAAPFVVLRTSERSEGPGTVPPSSLRSGSGRRTILAPTSDVPTWKRTRVRGPDDPSSKHHVGAQRPRRSPTTGSLTITVPRDRSSTSTPTRAIAARSPARIVGTARPWFWSPRTRTSRPCGSRRTVAPSASSPDQTVPVTTVPVPFTVKTLSIGRRKRSAVTCFSGTVAGD